MSDQDIKREQDAAFEAAFFADRRHIRDLIEVLASAASNCTNSNIRDAADDARALIAKGNAAVAAYDLNLALEGSVI